MPKQCADLTEEQREEAAKLLAEFGIDIDRCVLTPYDQGETEGVVSMKLFTDAATLPLVHLDNYGTMGVRTEPKGG